MHDTETVMIKNAHVLKMNNAKAIFSEKNPYYFKSYIPK